MSQSAPPSDVFNPNVLFPRLLHFGVSYGDLVRVTSAATDWQTWSNQLHELAETYAAMAVRAGDGAHRVSAAHFWRLASISS